MATATLITLEEYHQKYEGESGYEYWFGEVVRKPMVTLAHGTLAVVLAQLFYESGYTSAAEVDLRIDPDWEPRPDVLAILHPGPGPYPTKPVDIVAEVLSPSDTVKMVFAKCRNYERVGVAQIFVFDPEERMAWQWSRDTDNLERVHELNLTNGKVISMHEVWSEFERRMKAWSNQEK